MDNPHKKIFFERIGTSVSSENCVICLLSPILTLGASKGFSPVEGVCPHQKNSHQAKFQKTKTGLTFVCFLSLLLLVLICHQTYQLLKLNYMLDVLILLTDWLFLISTLVSIFDFPFLTKERITFWNGWVELCNEAKFYGFNSILSQRKRNEIFWYYRGFSIFIICLSLFLILYTSWFLYKLEFDQLQTTIFITLFCTFVQCCLASHFITLSMFIKGILENCENYLKFQVLSKTSVVLPIIYVETSLTESLRRIRKFYSGVMANNACMGKTFEVPFLIWFFNNILILIVNIFILVKFHITSAATVVIEIRTFLLIVHIIMMLPYIQSQCVPGEEMQSFLFRYPISKLTSEEAAQVELLIMTMTLQKPIMKAGDIFTVGTRLLASTTGTVVTYVLVALQFNASWAKE